MCHTKAKLNGKVAVVTGGNSGMGLEAAKELARRGARVILASRNETKLRLARDHIQETTGNYNVDYKVVDLESFQSVRNLAYQINHEPRLDILINNAGALGIPDQLTEDGVTKMMQINFFSAFLLAYLLFPLMRASAPSRIINSSAVSMYLGTIDFDHWNDVGRYSIWTASGNAKLATALTTVEWDRRIKGTNVTVNSFDPFFVRDTDISRHFSKSHQDFTKVFLEIFGRPKKEVGYQIAYYAAAPNLKRASGLHFKFCGLWPHHWLAGDRELGRRLWEETKRIVKITPEEDWEQR